MKNYDRNVSLLCGVCGNDHFEILDAEYEDMNEVPDGTRYKCSDCGRIVTKSELLEENEEVINANIEDIQREVVSEIEKELKKAFKNFGR